MEMLVRNGATMKDLSTGFGLIIDNKASCHGIIEGIEPFLLIGQPFLMVNF